jgi:hypothetical protein
VPAEGPPPTPGVPEASPPVPVAPLPDATPVDPAEVAAPLTPPPDGLSGADRLARRLAEEGASKTAPPRPSNEDLDIFFSLLGYHYGAGTLGAEEFSARWARVEAAQSLRELYAITADLSFPPPLAHIKNHPSPEPPRRRRWFR